MLCCGNTCERMHAVIIALSQVVEDGTVPMEKVFISVSGGELRSSNFTTEDGTVIYSDVVGVVRSGHGITCLLLLDFSSLYVCL